MIKKREVIMAVLVIAIIANVLLVFAATISYSSRNAPLGSSGACKKSPVLVDSDLTGVLSVKVKNIRGTICTRSANGLCADNTATGCMWGFKKDCSSKTSGTIGFYDNNRLIKEYSLASVRNSVPVPSGAEKAYVYFKDNWYYDNNGGFKCNFVYERILPCTPKTCADYPGQCEANLPDGCGRNLSCQNNCQAGQRCDFGACVDASIPAPECDNSQTILRLYSGNNSHGALWNYTPYINNICYNKIFGESYSGNIGHNCSGNNKIIRLSGNSNAHAEIPEETTEVYNTEVCFGDLECSSISSGECNNQTGEKTVVKLSSSTNAHLGNASSDYPVKICCKQGAASVYWANMIDEEIANADFKDSVKLVFEKLGISGEVNYEVYDKADNTKVWSFSSSAQTNSKAFAVWKSNQAGTFYFKVINNGRVVISGDLDVTDAEINHLPSISIINPVAESSYIMDKNTGLSEEIRFEQIAYDEDDDLNVTWDFGDGISSSFSNCLTGANCNTTHKYSQKSGTKMITVIAKEMKRSGVAKDHSRTFIYKSGLNIFAVIDKPDYKEPVIDMGIHDIDGTSSHISNCFENSGECTNFSGGKTCYIIEDEIDPSKKFYCYKFAESGQLGFKWIFDGIEDNTHKTSEPFKKRIVETGEHIINLIVNFTVN